MSTRWFEISHETPQHVITIGILIGISSITEPFHPYNNEMVLGMVLICTIKHEETIACRWNDVIVLEDELEGKFE